MLEIIVDVDGYEDRTAQNGDRSEQCPHHAGKPKEGDCIQTDFLEEFWLFGTDQRRQPSQKRIGYSRWLLVADVVFDLGFVDDLSRSMYSTEPNEINE